MNSRLSTVLVALAIVGAACGADTPASSAADKGPDTIVLVTHDSFAISPEVLASFTAQTGVDVEVLTAGDAGSMLNQAIITKDNPLGHVLYGIDNTFLSRAVTEGLFEPYRANGIDAIPAELLVNGDTVTPIDFGDVCINYDSSFDGPLPATLRDLTRPEYAGTLVVEDPATSSPGMAFLIATVATFGETGDYTWMDYWADLRANDVLVTSGWEAAYYGEFSGGSGEGDRPFVVGYASSPPAEVIFSEPRLTEAPTGVLTDGCFRQVEYAGLLAGSGAGQAGRALLDFMVSIPFQADIPLNMFVFPANADASLPPEFVEFTTVPETTATLDPDVIEANRDRWLDEWTRIVIR